MEPLIVGIELVSGSNLLMTLDLQLMQLSKVALGGDVGQEVGRVSEGGLFGANAAVEQGSHDAGGARIQAKGTKGNRQAQSNDC